MSESPAERLAALARTDPTVAPLALLQAEALRAAADKTWHQAVPTLDRQQALDGLPLLHNQTLRLDGDALHRLLERLARLAEQSGQPAAGTVRRALGGKRLDPPALLEASVAQDAERLTALASEADVDLGLLTALGQVLAWPLLLACGERAQPLLEGVRWEAGYCPVCAAWPGLAELRGIEREHWLRCGRCGSGWLYSHLRCAYCGGDDFRSLGYLAPEAQREARRAVTCDACQGYLKTLSSFSAIPPAELALQDLGTLELDVAAIERGYGRPTAPGFPLRVTIEAARSTGWLAWRR